jgi:hypothetical protein
MTGFTIKNGQFVGPNGNIVVPRGINNGQGMDTAQWMTLAMSGALLSTFPGLNCIRLNCGDGNFGGYQPPSYYAPFVAWATSQNPPILVLMEDHIAGQATNVLYSPSQLIVAENWYGSQAAYFKGNPWLGFMSMNEPAVGPTPQIVAIYNAIRAQGNTGLFGCELMGGGDTFALGAGNTAGAYPSSAYQAMFNAFWDLHNYPEDEGTVAGEAAFLASQMALVSQVGSGDGVMPIFLGEYGPGQSTSADAYDTVTATQNAVTTGYGGYQAQGSAAWAWDEGSGTNYWLLNSPYQGGQSDLTVYGQMVAAYLSTGTMPVTTYTTITPTSGGSITDGQGNIWTLTTAGETVVNGTPLASGSGTETLTVVNGIIWGQAASNNQWYTYGGGIWTPNTGTPSAPATVMPTYVPPSILSKMHNQLNQFPGLIAQIQSNLTALTGQINLL